MATKLVVKETKETEQIHNVVPEPEEMRAWQVVCARQGYKARENKSQSS